MPNSNEANKHVSHNGKTVPLYILLGMSQSVVHSIQKCITEAKSQTRDARISISKSDALKALNVNPFSTNTNN